MIMERGARPDALPNPKGGKNALVGGIVLTVIIVGAFILVFEFHDVVVAPCHATTGPHIVTDNLGNFYTTEYKHSGEWCQWVRGTFNRGS